VESRSTALPREPTSPRSILRVVTIVVACAVALYLVYLLRTPLGWLVLASFIAIVAAAPVNVLNRRMRRGFAIAIVYASIILVPIGILAILIPPFVSAIVDLGGHLPGYVQDLERTLNENHQLRELNRKFDLTAKLQEQAQKLAGELPSAAGGVADVGAQLVSSLFALVTVMVLSIFMVARGRSWVDAAITTRPAHHRESLRRAVDHIASAVASYVGGALVQATIAGISAFIVLEILGISAPLALAVVVAVLDLVPLIGATLGAAVVLIVTFFGDFPVDSIIWAIFAIAYQQFENYVVQPRIQSRAVALDPFIVVVAAIFGGTLYGIIGALLAIPSAAVIQISVREYLAYRRTQELEDSLPAGAVGPAPPAEPDPG
jgi:predicted PurR-regulated permease PerM